MRDANGHTVLASHVVRHAGRVPYHLLPDSHTHGPIYADEKFLPVREEWVTPDVISTANEALYWWPDANALHMVHDALLDAGCDDAVFLAHLKGPYNLKNRFCRCRNQLIILAREDLRKGVPPKSLTGGGFGA